MFIAKLIRAIRLNEIVNKYIIERSRGVCICVLRTRELTSNCALNRSRVRSIAVRHIWKLPAVAQATSDGNVAVMSDVHLPLFSSVRWMSYSLLLREDDAVTQDEDSEGRTLNDLRISSRSIVSISASSCRTRLRFNGCNSCRKSLLHSNHIYN